MSGKTAFCNIMSIISLGADIIISERTSQSYGQLLEEAVKLSLEILVLVMDRDIFLADFWRPLHQVLIYACLAIYLPFRVIVFTLFSLIVQPLDVILSQNPNWIFTLLEYIRYDFSPQIQQYSIKIMSILRYHQINFHFTA